jgi:hypothetical protein
MSLITLGSGALIARFGVVATLFLLYVVPITLSIPSKRAYGAGGGLDHQSTWGVVRGAAPGMVDDSEGELGGWPVNSIGRDDAVQGWSEFSSLDHKQINDVQNVSN